MQRPKETTFGDRNLEETIYIAAFGGLYTISKRLINKL